MAETMVTNSESYKPTDVSRLSRNQWDATKENPFANDPRMVKAKELFSKTGLPSIFFATSLNELFNDPKNFKNLDDFQSVFQTSSQSKLNFDETFRDFSVDQIVKKGNFNPTEAFSDWDSTLGELNSISQQMTNLVMAMNQPSMSKKESSSSVESTKAASSTEAEMGPFDYLYAILDEFIEMNSTFLELGMSYSLVLQNETEKQKVYLDIQSSLKPITVTAGYFRDPESDDTRKAVDTWNQSVLPGYQQENQSYNEMSQDSSKQINSMINQLTQAATKISDDFASLLSKFSSMAMSIFR